ncbi:MAG: MFS transporter [Deinococcales bacterium]
MVLRHKPEHLGLVADGRVRQLPEKTISGKEALKLANFWWLSLAFALSRVVIVSISAHMVPMLSEYSQNTALIAAVAGSVGLMQLLGRVIFTPLSARMPLEKLTSLAFLSHALAASILLILPGVMALWLFALFMGLANGARTLARAALIADHFGSQHYGTISGMMTSFIAIAQT